MSFRNDVANIADVQAFAGGNDAARIHINQFVSSFNAVLTAANRNVDDYITSFADVAAADTVVIDGRIAGQAVKFWVFGRVLPPE